MNKYSLLLVAGVLCTGHLSSMQRENDEYSELACELEDFTNYKASICGSARCEIADMQTNKLYRSGIRYEGKMPSAGQYIRFLLIPAESIMDMTQQELVVRRLNVFKMLSGIHQDKVFYKIPGKRLQRDFDGAYEKIFTSAQQQIPRTRRGIIN